jgi:hypothetical protein
MISFETPPLRTDHYVDFSIVPEQTKIILP